VIAAGLDPVEVLSTPADLITSISGTGQFGRPVISYMPEIDTWMATLVLPLNTYIAGREVTMAAKIDLDLLAQMVASHPFAQRGMIAIVDHAARLVLPDQPRVIADRQIVASAMPLIVAGARADALQPYVRPDGEPVLGAYAFPSHFPWAVITELSEDNAYAVVNALTWQIAKVGLVGLVLAAMGAFFMSQGLTGPILKIGAVAQKVGQGDFAVRVRGVRSRDEIGQLAREVNQMIAHLAERLELMKFVSHSTMSAIRKAEDSGMRRGGERRRVSVIFTDIRGYTSFSESVPPETVVEVLNRYFDVQAGLVNKYGGDVDKFIGDALVAVFEGERMEERAGAASVEIIADLQKMLSVYPEYNLHVGIGVASGEVVMGATGARDRMDFTVLGSTVNLSARLCSKAASDQVLVDEASQNAASISGRFRFEPLSAVSLKGYAEPVPVFAANLRVPVRA
jgi:adenylate cyclase